MGSDDDLDGYEHPSAFLGGPGMYALQVVGESFYQRELRDIVGRTRRPVRIEARACLILEDSNEYDDQAVRVDILGHGVGYLSRENARQYRAELERQGIGYIVGVCNALIVGDELFGVLLDLPMGG